MKIAVITACLLYSFTQVAIGAAEADAIFDKGAVLYDEGNYEEAGKILSPLVEQGDRRALYVFGLMYEFGKGVTADLNKAAGFYEKASKDIPGAMNQLGLIYLEGKSRAIDKKKAWELFKMAASSENKYGALNAARVVYWASPEIFTEQMLIDALKFARQARDSGLSDAEIFENTLMCALMSPSKSSNDIWAEESLSHYDVNGPVMFAPIEF